jgi:hypothetical protein
MAFGMLCSNGGLYCSRRLASPDQIFGAYSGGFDSGTHYGGPSDENSPRGTNHTCDERNGRAQACKVERVNVICDVKPIYIMGRVVPDRVIPRSGCLREYDWGTQTAHALDHGGIHCTSHL